MTRIIETTPDNLAITLFAEMEIFRKLGGNAHFHVRLRRGIVVISIFYDEEIL